MNFWALLCLILAAVYAVGFAALFLCAKFAREGYEDREGFHFGTAPAQPVKRPNDVTIDFARADTNLPNVA